MSKLIPALGPGFYFQLSVAASFQAVIAIPVNHRNIPGISAEAAGTGAQAGKNAVENNARGDRNAKNQGLRPVKPVGMNPIMDNIGVVNLDSDAELPKGGAKDGKSKDTQIWTETKKKGPVPNAYGHWGKHKSEFPKYQNSKQYVDATHNFVTNPSAGTLTTTHKKSDTIYYNQSTNTFAVKNADGVPKTMFRPDPADHGYPTNLDYFNGQK